MSGSENDQTYDKKKLQSILHRLQYILESSKRIPTVKEATRMLERALSYNLSSSKWTKIIQLKITQHIQAKTLLSTSSNTYLILPAHRILNAYDDEEINDNLFHEILNVVGSRKQIIKYLINTIEPEKTKEIIEILQTEKNNQDVLNNKINKFQSIFDKLSSSSITNICEFLTKHDIKLFKLTCVSVGIVCLQQMKKYKLSVFNMNELLYIDEYSNALHLPGNEVLKSNWYFPNTKTSIFKSIWSKRYNIPLQDMMICASNAKWAKLPQVYSTSKILKRIDHFADISFMLFNKRNVVVLNSKEAKLLSSIDREYDEKINERVSGSKFKCLGCDLFVTNSSSKLSSHLTFCGKKLNKMTTNPVTILQYFDIYNQQLKTIQFLQIDGKLHMNKLIEYIQRQLGSYLFQKSLEWYNKLLYTLTKMKQYDTTQELFNIYYTQEFSNFQAIQFVRLGVSAESEKLFSGLKVWKCNYCGSGNIKRRLACYKCKVTKPETVSENDDYATVSAKQKCIAFQLNYDHPYFQEHPIQTNSNKILLSNEIEPPVYTDFKNYFRDSNSKYRLSVKYFREDDIFEQHRKALISDIKISHKFEFMATEMTTFGKLREKISWLSNNAIPAQNIEIFNHNPNSDTGDTDYTHYSWQQSTISMCKSNKTLRGKWNNNNSLQWEMVAYDTTENYDEKKDNDNIVVQVQIFEANNAKPMATFPIKCNSECKVKCFIQNAFQIAECGLYRNSFESVASKYGKNVDNIDCEYSFVVMESESDSHYNLFKYYDTDDTLKFSSKYDSVLNHVNIYIGNNFMRKVGNKLQVPLIVRFCQRNSVFSTFDLFGQSSKDINENTFHLFSKPIKCWISKTETVLGIFKAFAACENYSFICNKSELCESYVDTQCIKDESIHRYSGDIETKLLRADDIVYDHLLMKNGKQRNVLVIEMKSQGFAAKKVRWNFKNFKKKKKEKS